MYWNVFWLERIDSRCFLPNRTQVYSTNVFQKTHIHWLILFFIIEDLKDVKWAKMVSNLFNEWKFSSFEFIILRSRFVIKCFVLPYQQLHQPYFWKLHRQHFWLNLPQYQSNSFSSFPSLVLEVALLIALYTVGSPPLWADHTYFGQEYL